MIWIKKFFAKRKDKKVIHNSKENELLLKLQASIEQCGVEKKKSGDEIDQIKKWANDAIRNAFDVPNQFWYEELDKYTEIKALIENKSLDYKVIIKCDQVVDAYFEQIKLREAKIKLHESLIEKYQQNTDKMQAIKKQRDFDRISAKKLNALNKHSVRLEQMNTNSGNLESTISESEQLDMLKNETNEVFEEFEISEEVRVHLEEINKEFKKLGLNYDSKLAIEKIENMNKKIKKENID